MFDAILIVPMFQIAWTFFSICTGFIYFQEYQVISRLVIHIINLFNLLNLYIYSFSLPRTLEEVKIKLMEKLSTPTLMKWTPLEYI
jgi:hypothetical protein